MSERVIIRRDADPIAEEPLVKFRLFYQGPLFASKGDAFDEQVDRRRGHKHSLRHAFHRQLRHYWQTHPWLSTTSAGWDVLGLKRDELDLPAAGMPHRSPYMWEHLARLHEVQGIKFVPLVCAEFKLLCELDILMLRRDRPGGIFQSRDIDNRLKTLFDALRMPKNGLELDGIEVEDEDRPMFTLLQDDSLITNVSVETDELLDPPEESGKDDSYVRLLIDVKLHPYDINMFNLSFA